MGVTRHLPPKWTRRSVNNLRFCTTSHADFITKSMTANLWSFSLEFFLDTKHLLFSQWMNGQRSPPDTLVCIFHAPEKSNGLERIGVIPKNIVKLPLMIGFRPFMTFAIKSNLENWHVGIAGCLTQRATSRLKKYPQLTICSIITRYAHKSKI